MWHVYSLRFWNICIIPPLTRQTFRKLVPLLTSLYNERHTVTANFITAIIFFLSCFYISFFLSFSSPNLSGRRLDVYRTSNMVWPYCEFRMQVWNVAYCTRLVEKSTQKSPSRHHRTTLSGHRPIFATKARIDNRRKNLLNSDTSSTCAHNMVNFGPLTAEICGEFGAPQQISTGFASLQRYCTAF